MRTQLTYVLAVVVLLSGCGSGTTAPTPEPEIAFYEVFPELKTNDRYHGVEVPINDNSWLFKSHIIDYPKCERAFGPHYCKKSQRQFDYQPDHTPGLETKYTFDLTVNKYNFEDSPYFIIIWQDWFDYDPNDENGNPPFSTLKLKNYDGSLYLGAFNNSWQWAYDYYNPYDPTDPSASDVTKRPENTETGRYALLVGSTYRIEILVIDGDTLDQGRTIISVNGYTISDESYQTKPLTSHRLGAVQFGMYWDRDYNPRFNGCVEATGQQESECKSNHVTIGDLRIFERINL